MKINYNTYRQAEPLTLYLAAPDGDIICPLNGIQTDSVKITMNLNDTAELSFNYDSLIDVYGVLIPTNGYDLLNEFMRIYVEQAGWFIMSAPQVSNDGDTEYKRISAQSADIELTNRDLVGFKVNCGTSDSIEMLAPDNVDIIDGVEFAKKQVTFCNKENPQLSLLHMLLSFAGAGGWDIGYIDEIPKVYRSYKDGTLIENVVQLKDEIGKFDVSTKNVYAFLTQDIEQFFECIIVFDILHMTINAYRPENMGKDTNVTIGFRNLQNSNDISVDKNSIYTRYRVSGDDNLGIGYVNFGQNMIENLTYFLNTKYMPESLISKYHAWLSDRESKRYEYMEHVRQYNKQLNVMSELKDRVPLDDCSTEWNKFSIEELKKAKDVYTAQLTGYESFYVDENGIFDEAKLAASTDANDYYQIRDVILPNIDIELSNRDLPTSVGAKDYIDSYKTNWKLYGIDELLVSLDLYQTQKQALMDAHYDIPYADYESGTDADSDSYPPHTRDMHEEMYAQYLDVILQLDETISGSCAHAFKERTGEYESAEAAAEKYLALMTELSQASEKENWSMDGVEPFTRKELHTLSKLYKDTDYTNNNMFLTNSDDQVTAIDEQLKLYDAAAEDLAASSQPQYTYSTQLDNFLAMYDYRQYTDNLELGDYLYLGIRDDYIVKLRLISYTFNPLAMDNQLQIEFSNMIKTTSKRYDTTYLLGLGGNTSKNSISGSSNNSGKNEGVSLTAGLIQKILSSSVFHNSISNAISQHFNSLIGQLIVSKNLEAEMVKTVDIHAEDGFFQYLQSQLIAADKIVADSGIIKQLDTLTAAIKNALIGTSSTETGIVVRLTADNAQIDEAFIKQVIAQYISVNELKAGNINTGRIHVTSEDGSLSIIGNTQVFKDKAGHTRIQLGQDNSGNFSFIVYDASGTGVIMDQNGIRESAVTDGLIKTDMISSKAVTADKIDWKSANAAVDGNGNPVWNSASIVIDGKGLDIQFASISDKIDGLKTSVEGVQSSIDAVNKSITDKVWRSDLVSVTDASGSTISKSIVDLLVEHNVSLNGLSSTVKEVQTAAGELTTRITKAEQDAKGFKQTVSETYATKANVSSVETTLSQTAKEIEANVTGIDGKVTTLTTDLTGVTTRVKNAEGNISSLQTTANGLKVNIEDAQGNITKLSQTAKNLESTVGKKQDSVLTSIRYIRDWLNGSSVDSGNHFVECRVMAGGTNIAAGLAPVIRDSNGNQLTESSNLSVYTNEKLISGAEGAEERNSYIALSAGKKCLELDLGSVRRDIDYIQIWHYYIDGRVYNHTLEVSSDGNKWYQLYDSSISNGYSERNTGATYYISEAAISDTFTNIKQEVEHISMTAASSEEVSNLSVAIDGISSTVSSIRDSSSTTQKNIDELKNAVEQNASKITQTGESITQIVESIKDNQTSTTEQIIDASGWKVLFSKLGMYDKTDITPEKTSVKIDENGITVEESNSDMKTVISTTEFAGYYGGVKSFYLSNGLTVTNRIKVENGLDTTTIKMIPRTYTDSTGKKHESLVYIKSKGTS